MMRRLDQRGAAGLEFCLVGATFFTLMFVIFDLGRYAIMVHSLRMLANAGARAVMIEPACATAALQKQSLSGCASADPLSTSAKQNVAPALYWGGLTPTL